MRWFGKQGPDGGPNREHREERKGLLNRERSIVAMALCADDRSSAPAMPNKDVAKEIRQRLLQTYEVLRDILTEKTFQSDDEDEIVGMILALARDARGATNKEKEKEIRDTVNYVTILKLKRNWRFYLLKRVGKVIPDANFIKKTGYDKKVNGIGEVIGFLPKAKKGDALYLGSSVQYEREDGKTGTGQITRFFAIDGIMNDPSAEAFAVYDEEGDEEISLSFHEIKQVCAG